jgi:hypothetical protein
MNTKSTPKSCSCTQCTRGKHTKSGRQLMRLDERAFRHSQKQKIKKSSGDYEIAPIGNYYD